MEYIKLGVVIVIIMSISLLATHFWVFIWDCIFGGIKRLFGFGKKKEIKWHTLQDQITVVDKDKISVKEKVINENERNF